MLTGGWVYVAALAASFVVATVASPAGVSGAVLLLPFQVGVLGTPSPYLEAGLPRQKLDLDDRPHDDSGQGS